MKTQHVIAIDVIGIPVVLGARGFFTALMLPAFTHQSAAKEVEGNKEAETTAKEEVPIAWSSTSSTFAKRNTNMPKPLHGSR